MRREREGREKRSGARSWGHYPFVAVWRSVIKFMRCHRFVQAVSAHGMAVLNCLYKEQCKKSRHRFTFSEKYLNFFMSREFTSPNSIRVRMSCMGPTRNKADPCANALSKKITWRRAGADGSSA